jgi:hypothetical protein
MSLLSLPLSFHWSDFRKTGEEFATSSIAELHKFLLLPLHIKLGLLKNYVKTMDRTGSAL